MKYKILFLALFIACGSLCCQFAAAQTIIGQANNGVPAFTYAKPDVILSQWNAFLEENSGIKAALTSLRIIRTDDGSYVLVANGASYESSICLGYNSTTGAISIMPQIKTTCTSEACAHTTGCVAQSNGTCSWCSGKCSKTTSSAQIFTHLDRL